MPRIFCIECGQEIRDVMAQFCPYCGKPRSSARPRHTPSTPLSRGSAPTPSEPIDINDVADLVQRIAEGSKVGADQMFELDEETAAQAAALLNSLKENAEQTLGSAFDREAQFQRELKIGDIACTSPGETGRQDSDRRKHSVKSLAEAEARMKQAFAKSEPDWKPSPLKAKPRIAKPGSRKRRKS